MLTLLGYSSVVLGIVDSLNPMQTH